MAKNNKGKAIFTWSDDEEWVKVLNNYLLSDLVLEGFGVEPISEYGSYRKIPKELRERILIWLRKHDFYYEELFGVTEEKEQAANTELPEVGALERRISNVKDVFKYLNDMKERKERKKMGDAESSGSNF